MHILGFILESGKSLVIALNKWDAISSYEKENLKKAIDKKLPFVKFAEKIFISALKQDGLPFLMKAIIKSHKAAQTKFSTPQLNSVLSNAIESHNPKIVKGIRPKLKYAHQGGINPPTVIIHGNHLDGLKQDYVRFLESFYRNAFDLTGTPLRIQFKNSTNPFEEKSKVVKKTGLVTRRKDEIAFREKMKKKKQKI